ncbi:hypothetical protein [Jongsikchunia kroppenstedtii]|uniref:hypothetical protein n=1 Tax=Jongsikchunia kroppenstedtii TaxID=1121721 RepID=UPI00037B62F9|nr:hypothetical protein [Jongsikchunia kroppenstedtii]
MASEPDEQERQPIPSWRTPAIVIVVIVALVGALWLIGNANPQRRAPVSDDAVGPTSGEPVDHYLARARASLDRATGSRWALVSLTRPVTAEQAWTFVAGPAADRDVLLSQAALHVSIPNVQTPTTMVPVSSAAALNAAPAAASWKIAADAGAPSDPPTRDDQVAAVVAARLSHGGDCVIGLVVRADASILRRYAAEPGVRAVEALPADARGGRFAVVPLLPEQTTVVQPLADTGPVPPA